MPAYRFQKIEYGILRMLLQSADHLGHPTDLNSLATFFRPTFADIDNRELVEALKRLRPKYLTLCKYVQGQPSCLEYPTQIADDEEFFYRGDGFRLRRTPETDPRAQELAAVIERQEESRNARFEHLEKLGLDRVKHDLLNGGFRWVGGTLEQQEEAWEWVRMKESQSKMPDTALLERVLGNIVNKAEESWTDIGRRVLIQAAAKGLHGRLHLEAKEQVDRFHEAAINQMVESISKFAGRNDLPISSLFRKFETQFADLNALALKPVEQVARTVFRESTQQSLLERQLEETKHSFEERCKRAQEEKEFEALNGVEEAADRLEPDECFIAATRIKELKELSSPDFAFKKLIRLCEELNSSYMNGNYYATAMLTRGVLDHVPPLFGHSSFVQVASNYAGGGKSFKEAMEHLQGAAKKIGDGHLHTHIRKTETLPTRQQVSCGQQLDLLLGEIIRIKK
jgi:hypothetical protein